MVHYFMDFKLHIRLLLRRLYHSRGIVFRALLCWGIGCLILVSDEVNSYDQRFQLRGDQPSSHEIVLITINPSDITGVYRFRPDHFGPLREFTDITDSFYWDPKLWKELLTKILPQNPKKIGISFFFSERIGNPGIYSKIFLDPRIIWGTNNSTSDRINLPLFANDIRTNVGSLPLLRDEDGIIRRFVPVAGEENIHLTERMAETQIDRSKSRFINFRGPGKHFPEYDLIDILEDKVPKNAFTDKYVIIGPESTGPGQYLTPVGSNLRHETYATLLDNILAKRWIYRANNSVYMAGLFALMILSVLIITGFPQSVAFILLTMTAVILAAISAWVFDAANVWIPAASPTIQILATWTIFLGYQANKIERQNWNLQREQKYLAELEQLKNNFVSLISHDLKTPIAKIQAIVDRLLLQDAGGPYATDLKSLRLSSEELNRYIQSILKVLRIESRDFQLNKEVGDINETIQEAILQLKPLAAEKNIRIKDQLEPMFSIEVDFTLIREVMINLIENAIKYSGPGTEISVTSKEVKENVWIEVKDQGQGIPAEEMQNVWGKFVRGKDQDLKTKGTGLGLYLVKYFIELHGGQVFIESSLGQGTTVSFSLPLETDEEKV